MDNCRTALFPIPQFSVKSRKRVLYDMKDDFGLPEYIVLKDFEGLFSKVRLDKSRTCVYWNDYVDVPSDIIYEYGKPVS